MRIEGFGEEKVQLNSIFSIIPSHSLVFKDEKYFKRLSQPEANLLIYMNSKPFEIITRNELCKVGWGKRPVSANNLNVAISNIRSALEETGISIHTISKVGYALYK